MKQHITVEQLNELSRDAYDKLIDMPKMNRHQPLLSIGQMIEFLQNERGFTSIEGPWMSEMVDKWSIALFESNKSVVSITTENEELCDALWNTVKEVLNG